MMRIAIKTAGVNGKNLYDGIKKNACYDDIEVVLFADQATALINTFYDGVPVVSDYKLAEFYKNGKVDLIVIPSELFRQKIMRGMAIQRISKDLIALGIDERDIRVANLLAKEMIDGKGNGAEIDFVRVEDFCHIRYLEFPIAYHCNLNCKACSHFSPLINEEFPVYEQVEKDFRKLKELVPFIGRIRVLGGEPLLNKEIGKYVKMVRELYPYSEIDIVTNGILIKKMSQELWDIIRENDIIINISVYPPMRPAVDDIISYLREKEIGVSVSNNSEFMPTFAKEKEHYPYTDLDYTCQFYYFADGFISSCMLMHDIKFFNTYFGKSLPGEDALINIYEEGLTGKELVRRLKVPGQLCDYCVMYKHMSGTLAFYNHPLMNVGWDVYKKDDKPQIEDWVVRD